jgi:ELWxxDGT repeat protein
MTHHDRQPRRRILALSVLAGLLFVTLLMTDRTPVRRSPLRLKPRAPARLASKPAPGPAATARPQAPEAPVVETEPETLGTFADPFPRAVPVQSVDAPPDAEGRIRRLRVVRAKAKFPFIRYEETLVDDPDHGRVIVSRLVMAADHIMVQLRKGVERKDLELLAAKHGCRILRPMHHPGGYVVGLPSHDVQAVPGAIDRFRVEAASIAIAEPDFVRTISQAQSFPDDPRFPSQWGLHNTGQVIVPFNPQVCIPEHWMGGDWLPITCEAGKDIKAPEGWDYVSRSNERVIAVIDTGVDQTHPDLERWKFRHLHEIDPDDGVDDDGNGYIDDFRGWDFVDGDNNPAQGGTDCHGTHVAGIAAAEGDNAQGIAGVNWAGVVMALRAGTDDGGFFDQDIVDAIDYATENVAYVANCSFAGPGFHAMTSAAIDRALGRPVEKGGPMLMVCAAANQAIDNDVTPYYPASYPQGNIISVLATDFTDAMPAFSNWGRFSVDIGAPGDYILSTVPGGGYEFASGTSMAAPFVAGAVTLVATNNAFLKPLEVRDCILNGAEPVPGLAGLCVTGGRLNLKNAMVCPSAPPPPPPGNEIVQFESAVYVADEGVGYAEVTVARTGLGQVSVGVYTTDGTATAPADYEANSWVLDWAAGEAGPKGFRIFLQDDGYVEATETIQLYLTNPVGAQIGPQGSATLNVNDNDVAATSQGSNPRNFFNLGSVTSPSYNHVWLFAATTADGEELWRTDGTSAGTYRVKDINPGPGSSSPADFTLDWYQGWILFTADDGVHGRELWVTDGTEAGTLLFYDLVPGSAGSSPAKFVRTVVGGQGRVFFTALTGSGEELWATDGATEGTYQVLDINPGVDGSLPSIVVPAQCAAGQVVLFAATDPVGGRELWRSDGTAAGTVQVRNLRNGANSSNPEHLVNAGASLGTDEVYFSAIGTQGKELWKTDGTQAGTVQVKDIRVGGASSPQQLTAIGPSLVYFSANDGTTGRELWRSDGTEAGTVRIRDLNPGTANSSPVRITASYSGDVYFAANGGEGVELWKTDGTDAGTSLVKDIYPGATGSVPQNLANVATLAGGPVLVFSATDGASGREIWTSDGTEAGTTLFKDLRAGTGNSSPADFRFTLVNDREQFLFTAVGTGFGRELWRSDGTAAGTILIKNIR